MFFKDLIHKFTWKQIIENLIKLYPDQKKNIAGYHNIYLELLSKSIKKSNMTIHIEFTQTEEESYFHIFGKNGEVDKEISNHEITWALELSSVSEWLGYIISDELLKEMSEIDIICHCLFEITFFGYSNEIISKERKKLHKLSNDIKTGKVQTYPLDLEKDIIDGNKSE